MLILEEMLSGCHCPYLSSTCYIISHTPSLRDPTAQTHMRGAQISLAWVDRVSVPKETEVDGGSRRLST